MRRLAWTAAAFALLVVLAWLAIPPLARWQLQTRLTEALGRATTVEAVAFDPLRLRLAVRNLAIADTGRAAPLLAFDELLADVSTASIWHRAPVFDAVRVTHPRVSLARDRAGRYNVQDLIDRALAPAPPGPPPRFSINNIEIVDGEIAFDDDAAARSHRLASLNIGIPFLSSLPYEADIRVTPRVDGALNGAHFALSGTTTPFAEHREATLDVDLDSVQLPPYVAYLPERPALELASGALTTRLRIVFVERSGSDRQLEIRGDAHVDGMAITRPGGRPLVAADRIAVSIDRIALPAREARIGKVTIASPTADVARLADGTLELAHPLFPNAAAPASVPAAVEAPWNVTIAEVAVERGTVALHDETSGFRSTLVDVQAQATNLSTRAGEIARVKLAFVSSDRIASFSGEADVDPRVPSANGRFELSKFSLALLFPYYKDVLNVDVQKGSLDFASRFVFGERGLAIREGTASIGDLVLALPGNRAPLWRIPALSGSAIDVDVAQRRIVLGELRGRGAALRVVRERNGSLEFARILKPAPAAAEAGRPDWAFAAHKALFDRVAVDVEDRVPQPAVKIALRELELDAASLSNASGSKAQLRLRTRIGDRGQLAFAGTAATRPLSLSGTLDARNLAIVPVKAYFEPEVNVVVTSGFVSANGRLAVDVPEKAPARASWIGRVLVSDFAALDKPTSSDLARWKSLLLDDLDVATAPFRAGTARIALEDFHARLIVYPDATLNLARLVTPGQSPEPAPDAKPTPSNERADSRDALPLTIGRIEVARGSVNFTDLFVRPNYSANLTDVAGSVSTLSAEQAGDVALTARVDGTAPVEISGRVHPFAHELSLDLTGKARDVDLPPLTPYSVKYAGYGIEKGKLAFDVHYRVENRKLAAQNRLVLDQLTFGERVESPTATKLPVLLAVALLKDSRGVIDIQLPISGSLDDPQFSVGGLIVRVIVNLITKAVTAPFALLSAVFGGGEELSTLDFAAGSAAIADDAKKRIDTLGKALGDRPALKLDIAGRADPAADREALRHAAVENALRREKMKALAAAGTAPPSLDAVTIAADERGRWLAAAYREAPLPGRPKNVLGMLKDVPPADMEAMLYAAASVDDAALRELANRRAQAVKDAIAVKGIAGERLFLVAPRIGNEAGGAKADAVKSASPMRVDLALR